VNMTLCNTSYVHISPNVSLAGDVTVGTGSHVSGLVLVLFRYFYWKVDYDWCWCCYHHQYLIMCCVGNPGK
jgi:hypothetical protein